MDLSSWSPSALLVAPLLTLVLDGSSVAQGAPPSPTELLRQTQDTYDSLRSYSSAGEVTSTFSPAGLEPQQFTHSFTMRLARPALYRIEWEQRSANFLMKGAAWSTGEGHFVIGPGQARPAAHLPRGHARADTGDEARRGRGGLSGTALRCPR